MERAQKASDVFAVRGVVSPLVGRDDELGALRSALQHAVEYQAPQVVSVLLYGVIAFLLLKGLMVSMALAMLARLAPRKPRWWT